MIYHFNFQEEVIMKYRIEVTEHISAIFETEADTREQALDIIKGKYFDEKITVESEDGLDVSFRVLTE